jgi:Icc protein
VMAGGLRVVALDSTTPAGHHGELAEAQLDWLRAVLSEPAAEGTIIAIHHPPIASPVRLIAGLLLHEPERLAEVVTGTDVRMIISGHTHHVSCGSLGGVPVWVAPANVYYTEVMPSGGKFGGNMGGGFTRIDVVDGVPVATAIPFGDGSPPLYEHDTDALLALAESYPRG